MIAFDTNLLVRAVVADEPAQVAIVRDLVMQDTVFISRTVLLETEWVLRAIYKKSRTDMLKFFRALLEIDSTEIEDSSAVGLALDWYALGADFADAMHLAVCGSAVMHTFDKGFCKAAREAGITPPIKVIVV
ncbi:putative nucleic-acid-binding protein [Methylobacter tundripaludum]|uniref:Putative nucleic-acid-binding protein n=1 Tax=Methylobacter tundripaludum TaxID=173365 RepID=A0A2S6HIC8_9GAMM|nr:type II toxin-antitoxin system VapC family toxin [Methylobacter tundripaludum]PPK77235.1 putative nucleic-acid-binding protein [Methylobacter tundripaludum]